MLKLENQLASLPLSKQLKELGFAQESLFYYARHKGIITPVYRHQLRQDGVDLKDCISAYSVAELESMITPVTNGFQVYFTDTKQYRVTPAHSYWNEHCGDLTSGHCDSDTFVDALAKLLCYLKTNNLI